MEDTTIEDMLKTVESSFAKKDYSAALKNLESNQSQIPPGLWHYNMGTVYGKMENYPLARYHLLRAQAEGFISKESFSNLELVERKLDIEKLEKPVTTTDYFVLGGLTAAQGILGMVSLCLIIVAIFTLWKKNSLKVFGLILLPAFIFIGLNVWINNWNRQIVINPQPIFEGPSAIFEARNEIPSGVMVIVNEKDGWLQIVYPSRYQGWVKPEGLKELK